MEERARVLKDTGFIGCGKLAAFYPGFERARL
jgi:hypothetical protein